METQKLMKSQKNANDLFRFYNVTPNKHTDKQTNAEYYITFGGGNETNECTCTCIEIGKSVNFNTLILINKVRAVN